MRLPGIDVTRKSKLKGVLEAVEDRYCDYWRAQMGSADVRVQLGRPEIRPGQVL